MTDRRTSLKWAMAVAVLLVAAVPAIEAQEMAGSFEELRSRVSVGDRVTVIDTAGRETAGRIRTLSASALALTVDGAQTDFAEADVATVSRRDSRWNGTIWGLVAGAVLGVSFEKSLANEYGRDDIGRGSAIVPFALIGSGIGFVVDALIKGHRVIYVRNTRPAARPRSAGE